MYYYVLQTQLNYVFKYTRATNVIQRQPFDLYLIFSRNVEVDTFLIYLKQFNVCTKYKKKI